MRQRRSNLNNIPGAKVLRARETQAEAVLWGALRSRKLSGLKLRRQHPIGPFVADFCCADQRLIVELDGEIHASQRDRDVERTELLEGAGYVVLRFPNEQVLQNLPSVLAAIEYASRQLPQRAPGYVSRRDGW